MGEYEERNTLSFVVGICYWAIPKNSKHGGGGWSVIKKEVEFPGEMKKTSCVISRGIDS